jgi:hypothetical protein
MDMFAALAIAIHSFPEGRGGVRRDHLSIAVVMIGMGVMALGLLVLAQLQFRPPRRRVPAELAPPDRRPPYRYPVSGVDRTWLTATLAHHPGSRGPGTETG